MKRTGSASPVIVARSRSMTALRVVPGSALTERTSAMPSPATISRKRDRAGREAGQIDAQPLGKRGVDVGDAAFLVGGEEAGRRVVEVVDRLLQIEEEALLLGALLRNVGELPGEQRLPLARHLERARADAVPARAAVRRRAESTVQAEIRRRRAGRRAGRRPAGRWSARPRAHRKAALRPSSDPAADVAPVISA